MTKQISVDDLTYRRLEWLGTQWGRTTTSVVQGAILTFIVNYEPDDEKMEEVLEDLRPHFESLAHAMAGQEELEPVD
jgi:predicted DNA-binding protein